jgi:hypothetical protein
VRRVQEVRFSGRPGLVDETKDNGVLDSHGSSPRSSE